MTQVLQIEGRFGYPLVKLDKTEANSLGLGSYGAVYRATCDQLPCAAKVLHPMLFSTRDPAARRIVERFQQECQFLSEMRHPNIIQYLGTCRDLQTGLPVLFMELMDQNLTTFLESTPTHLPFHDQVDITLDVAQALAYLHSHDIIHRDLSSNNVLLIGKSRAKVTDFRMSKLTGVTEVRMTPIRLTNIPGTEVYMPPEAFLEPPEYSNKLDCFSLGVLGIQIMTREFPTPGHRRTVVEVPISDLFPDGRAERVVKEVDRRQNHIATIPDKESPILSMFLDCLKDDEGHRPTAVQLCCELTAMKEVPQYQDVGEELDGSPVEDFSDQELESDEEEGKLRENLQSALNHAAVSDVLVAELQNELEAKCDAVLVLEEEINVKERKIQDLRGLEREIQTKDRVIRSMEEEIKVKKRKIQDLQGLEWEMGRDAPHPTYGESAAVLENKAYFCDGCSESKIFEYDSKTGVWCVIDCPRKCFSIAIVDRALTVIGGEVEDGRTLLTQKIQSSWFGLSQRREWVEELPPMRYRHVNPMVACAGTALIVVGGRGNNGVTEVLDAKELQWSTVASFPSPWSYSSAAILNDHLYVAGRFIGGEPTKSVLRCNILELVHSRPPNTAQRATVIWSPIAELPVSLSTVVVFQDRLLAVGGQLDGLPTPAVYRYNPANNSWKVNSHMNVPRFRCLAAVLPDKDKLMVVGGDTRKKSVELASYPKEE